MVANSFIEVRSVPVVRNFQVMFDKYITYTEAVCQYEVLHKNESCSKNAVSCVPLHIRATEKQPGLFCSELLFETVGNSRAAVAGVELSASSCVLRSAHGCLLQ